MNLSKAVQVAVPIIMLASTSFASEVVLTEIPAPTLLRVNIVGNGRGSVTYVEGHMGCKYSSDLEKEEECYFPGPTVGEQMTLIATPSIGRELAGWSPMEKCTFLEGAPQPTCIFKATSPDDVVTVEFRLQENFRNKRTSSRYGTLNEALMDAEDDDVIMALAKVIPDPSVVVDAYGKTVTIAGGYYSLADQDINQKPIGYTEIDGSLNIRTGTVVADRLVIK